MAAEDAIATGANAAQVVDSTAGFVAVDGSQLNSAGSLKGSFPLPSMSMTNAEAAELLRGVDSCLKPNLSRYGYRFFKRTIDVCASGLGIAILLIPGAVLSAAICIKSPGSGPLYSQVRIGRLKNDGTYSLFRMWKFRSMVPNADEMLKDLQDRNEADGPLFKIKDDPRIIPGLGSFIRKHSIDELPQLLNVFCGQMSLIGPRPALPVEVLSYDERAKRRLTVKPGCGGAWQAGNRSDSTFDEMVTLDLMYVDHSSVRYDLRLVFNTLRAMIVGGVPTRGIPGALSWAVTPLG